MPKRTFGADTSAAVAPLLPATQPDRELFIAPASNERGEYRTISVAVTPEIKAIIERACHEGIATGKFPWKVPAEVTRWAIVTGLRSLAKIADDERLALPFHALSGEVDDLELTRRQIQSLYDKLTVELTYLVRIGKDESAAAIMQTTMLKIDAIPSSPWRDWLIEELERRFPQFLVAPPAPASLHPQTGAETVRRARHKRPATQPRAVRPRT